MKHTEMVALMGKVVTVHATLLRSPVMTWHSLKCPPWAGWIVGFTYRLDGRMEDSIFIPTKSTPCVLVTSWPSKRPDSVPLDGYTLGGTPVSPDFGGWRNFKRCEAAKATGVLPW